MLPQIEWIKGLLAVPFVLLSQPTALYSHDKEAVKVMAINAHARYAQIMQDVEEMINDHISQCKSDASAVSKLKLLVPSIGLFFTTLPLTEAFAFQDQRRFISSRRFVAPSFNDIRLILNTAQVMSLVRSSKLELVTFDGDVTLYDDGQSLTDDNPCIPRILDLMRKGTRVGIVTAAGYIEAEKYYERLHGLLDAIAAQDHSGDLRHRLVVMGGESNFLFTYTNRSPCKLEAVLAHQWKLPEMATWTEENVKALLDVGEAALRDCIDCMKLPVQVLRKERAVGIYPEKGVKLSREQLEETVLVVQRILEMSPAGRRIPFCAFNGGNDIFIDVGDKSWGVMACQRYFGGIHGGQSLHVGDQFLSAGANDFKVNEHIQLVACSGLLTNPRHVWLVRLLGSQARRRLSRCWTR